MKIKNYLSFASFLVLFISCTHNQYSSSEASTSDSIQILLQDYQRQIGSFPDSAFNSAERALNLSQHGVDGQTTMFEIFFALGVASEKSGQYNLAISYFDKAIKNSKKAPSSRLATLYNHFGQTALQLGRYDLSMEYFPKALKIRIDQDDLEGQASSYRNIGSVYQTERKFREAEEHYQKSLQLYRQLDNIEGQAACYNNLGGLFAEQVEFEKALENYWKSEQYYRKNNSPELFLVIYNIGLLMQDLGEYEQACHEYHKALKIAQNQLHHRATTEACYSLGRCWQDSGKADSAIYYFNKTIETAQQFDFEELESWALRGRAECYTQLGRFVEATDDYDSAFILSEKLNIKNQEKARLFTQRYMQYEEGVRQEQQLQRNRTLRNYIVALVCLIMLINAIVVILYRNNVQKKKTNAQLSEQRDKIAKQHQEITESIHAASLLQKAVLPPTEYMNHILDEYFVLNMPRNTVSGDFYWMTQKGAYKVIAVADCTGHGVSGAIVSMLGISSLNKIVSEMEIPQSDVILNQLRDMIILLLNPEGAESNTRNGMDMALVVVNTLSHEIEFSGARNPLYWIHNGELIEQKADKMSIGADEKQNRAFTAEKFVYTEGDMLYMFSDGYCDQFDSANQEQFKKKRFKNLLLFISEKPLHEQLRIIERTHLDWRGSTKQTDDILVFGLKL